MNGCRTKHFGIVQPIVALHCADDNIVQPRRQATLTKPKRFEFPPGMSVSRTERGELLDMKDREALRRNAYVKNKLIAPVENLPMTALRSNDPAIERSTKVEHIAM